MSRLYHLNESINGGYGDIGVDASTFHGAHGDVNLLNNYKYDELGNLIADKREEIANIEWAVSGKVKHITRTAGSTKPELWFTYGADGQRTSKTIGDPLNGGYREWYLRDAQGNIMAIYRHTNTGPKSLKVTDRPVYGSSRLGSYTRQIELVGEQAITNYPYTQPMQAPLKRYELTDHLGNVNTVVTGRLLPGNGAGSAKQAEVVSAQTHEVYGSLLPNRNWESDKYAWGFNTQLKDNEVYGPTGTSTTAEFWQYDTRAARRWNLDPVPQMEISDYATFRLNPVLLNDPDGDCPTCPTMAVGGLVGFGVGIYDLSQQEGGFFGAISKLASGDGKAWAHVGTTTLTGVAVGSGVGGFAGAVGISATSSAVDQYVQTGTVDPKQVAVSGAMGGVGWGAGKIVGSTILAPKTAVGTGLTPIAEKIVIPKNNLPQVLGVEAGLAVSGSVAEKVATNAVAKPPQSMAPVAPQPSKPPPTKAPAPGESTGGGREQVTPSRKETHITL